MIKVVRKLGRKLEILMSVHKALPESVKSIFRRSIYEIRNRRFQPYLKKKSIEGVSFDFWIGDIDGRDWYDLKCTDPIWIEMRFTRDHMIERGDVILECGAHHGCTTILPVSYTHLTLPTTPYV